jgi:hypothetical protein
MNMMKGLGTGTGIAGLVLIIAFSGSEGLAQEFTSEFVGQLPGIRDVFTNLFAGFVLQSTEDQLKALIEEKTTEDEKIAIRNFLGDEGIAKLRSMAAAAAPEKESLLDPLDKALAGKTTDLEFKDAFARIDAKTINLMSVSQLEELYSSLDEKEMGTISFYLGLEGLACLWNNIPAEKAEVILSHTPDWLLLEMGKKKLATMNTYESVMYKQERLGEDLQGVETIILKFRQKPWALYMKWIDGPWESREILFNEQRSTTHVRVRESGILGLIAVDIPLTSSLARRGSNHVPTEIGIFYLLGMIEKDYSKAAPLGDITRKNLGIQEVHGRKVFVMDSILPRDETRGYYCYRMRHYIDYQRSLLIKAEIFNWNDELAESYTYTKIEMNPPYTDFDFDPENPEYDL